MKRVVVLGGTGIFGGRIARALAATEGLAVCVAGREPRRGEALAQEIGAGFVRVDLADERTLAAALDGCALLIHAAGPFQGRDYAVARACIERGASYLDLADAREFVTGIGALDTAARARGVFVGSGASSSTRTPGTRCSTRGAMAGTTGMAGPGSPAGRCSSAQ